MDQNKLKPDFFLQALGDNPSSLVVRAEALVVESFAERAVVPCRYLAVEQFARMDLCELQPAELPRPILHRYWGGEDCDQLFDDYEQVMWEIRWQGHELQVVHLRWDTSCGGDGRDWVVAPSAEIAEQFILDVERHTHAPGNAILVFTNGRWNRSESLYMATQSASFDDLILADDLKQHIRDDFHQFLQSEDRYQRLGIAWRRGALLVGPPGNGKTHCVRALVKELAISSLYVQSLSHNYFTPEQLWQTVFDRARGLRPCVLVLEDLDSLVTEENRSFFLNQLDGFERNHGLIVLATTNYPNRIDPAIIDRPSRFDRKYHFPLPSGDLRSGYLQMWQQQLSEETGWQAEEVDGITLETEGFSFAYLKELVISSVMKWMQESDDSFAMVMAQQAVILRGQMKTEAERPAPKSNGRRRRRQRF